MLKNLVKIILTVLVVFLVVFAFNFAYKNKDQIFSQRKCSKTIEYSLGGVDKNFGISDERFLGAVKSAENMWEKSVGRELFDHSKDGGLKVNLVFDQRQEDTTRMKEILSGISSEEDKLSAVKKEYLKLTGSVEAKEASLKSNLAKYREDQIVYEELISIYNAKVSDYERRIDLWNNKGGAPQKEYEQLLKEKVAIDTMFSDLSSKREALQNALSTLEAERKDFNSQVSQLNTVAGIFNRLADKLNTKVVAYNEVQGSMDEFISGLYTSDAKRDTIDIFQFYDNEDLIITIAHEMGHALGLGHATGANSIMYHKAEGQKTEISEEDLGMLRVLCNQ